MVKLRENRVLTAEIARESPTVKVYRFGLIKFKIPTKLPHHLEEIENSKHIITIPNFSRKFISLKLHKTIYFIQLFQECSIY